MKKVRVTGVQILTPSMRFLNTFFNFSKLISSLKAQVLYRSCIALFYRKRLPQQDGDRRIGERDTCMRLIVCGSKMGARALPSPHTQ